jgi:flagellar biosynthesis GTPase FlhF
MTGPDGKSYHLETAAEKEEWDKYSKIFNELYGTAYRYNLSAPKWQDVYKASDAKINQLRQQYIEASTGKSEKNNTVIDANNTVTYSVLIPDGGHDYLRTTDEAQYNAWTKAVSLYKSCLAIANKYGFSKPVWAQFEAGKGEAVLSQYQTLEANKIASDAAEAKRIKEAAEAAAKAAAEAAEAEAAARAKASQEAAAKLAAEKAAAEAKAAQEEVYRQEALRKEQEAKAAAEKAAAEKAEAQKKLAEVQQQQQQAAEVVKKVAPESTAAAVTTTQPASNAGNLIKKAKEVSESYWSTQKSYASASAGTLTDTGEDTETSSGLPWWGWAGIGVAAIGVGWLLLSDDDDKKKKHDK